MADFHLAWVSTFDPRVRRGGYQGAHHHLYEAVRTRVPRLTTLAPLTARTDLLAMFRSRLLTACTGQRLLWPYSDRRLQHFANACLDGLQGTAADAVLFFGSAAHLRTFPTSPFAVFCDSAFVPYLEFYEGHRHYTPKELERMATREAAWMARAHRVFTTSDYARTAILRAYPGVQATQVEAVGIGPNFAPSPATPGTASPAPSLLLVATDFARKGGPLAIEAVGLARQHLPDLTLDIVGSEPPPELRRPYVRCHGWVDQTTPAGAARFSALLRQSSLFLLLSSADLTPNAICEAFAHAVPVLAFATGGVPEMVRENLTGWLLRPGQDASAVAHRLVEILQAREALATCRAGAARAYADEWNWSRVADRVLDGLRAPATPGAPS